MKLMENIANDLAQVNRIVGPHLDNTTTLIVAEQFGFHTIEAKVTVHKTPEAGCHDTLTLELKCGLMTVRTCGDRVVIKVAGALERGGLAEFGRWPADHLEGVDALPTPKRLH